MTTQNDRNRDRRSNQAGRNQQEREQGTGNRPWGYARAIIPAPGDNKTRFVAVGTVWESENGNLKVNLESEPNQWRDPHFPRSVILIREVKS